MEIEDSVNEEDVSIKLLPNEGEVSGNKSGSESDGTIRSEESADSFDIETWLREKNHKKV